MSLNVRADGRGLVPAAAPLRACRIFLILATAGGVVHDRCKDPYQFLGLREDSVKAGVKEFAAPADA